MAEPPDNSVCRQNLCGRLQLYCPPPLQIPEHQVTQSHHTDARGGVSIEHTQSQTDLSGLKIYLNFYFFSNKYFEILMEITKNSTVF